MKILFVYPNTHGTPGMPMGLGYLSALAKRDGNATALFDTSFVPRSRVLDALEECFDRESPDLLAVSILSHEWSLTRQMLRRLFASRRRVPVVVGGPHPTVSPEQVMADAHVSFLFRGETENVFPEFLRRLNRDEDVAPLDNLWLKRPDGSTVKNPPVSVTMDLDSLPFPDWGLFDTRHFAASSAGGIRGIFESQRGCPYACSYCINSFLKTVRGKQLVRVKSVDRTIAEMKQFMSLYPCDWVHFTDELFILTKKRLQEFAARYSSEVGLPFSFMLRPEGVREDWLRLAYQAGGREVSIGVECGNEKQRRELLGRQVSNDTIRNAFRVARRVGLVTTSFNILGFPGETREMLRETVTLNREIQPDRVTCSVLFPYEGTTLYQRFFRDGLAERYHRVLDENVFNEPVFEVGTGLTRQQVARLRGLIPAFFRQPDPVIDLMFLAARSDALHTAWRAWRRVVPRGLSSKLKRLGLGRTLRLAASTLRDGRSRAASRRRETTARAGMAAAAWREAVDTWRHRMGGLAARRDAAAPAPGGSRDRPTRADGVAAPGASRPASRADGSSAEHRQSGAASPG